MQRFNRLSLVCLLAVSGAGCYGHHTVEEDQLAPVATESETDGGVEIESTPGTVNATPEPSDSKPIAEPPKENPAKESPAPAMPALPSPSDCKKADPNDVVTQVLCAATNGGTTKPTTPTTPAGPGGILGGQGNNTPPGGLPQPSPLECLTTQDTLTKLLCALQASQAGGNTGPGGLLGGTGNGAPGGGFPGGGFPGGNGGGGFPGAGNNGNGNNGNGNNGLPTAQQCKKADPNDVLTQLLCSLRAPRK